MKKSSLFSITANIILLIMFSAILFKEHGINKDNFFLSYLFILFITQLSMHISTIFTNVYNDENPGKIYPVETVLRWSKLNEYVHLAAIPVFLFLTYYTWQTFAGKNLWPMIGVGGIIFCITAIYRERKLRRYVLKRQ